jgi:hypothetical protein
MILVEDLAIDRRAVARIDELRVAFSPSDRLTCGRNAKSARSSPASAGRP